LEEVV
jgi:hypothetical protein